MEKKAKILSFSENVFLGVIGGSIETIVHMPLITLKICQQEGRNIPKNLKSWYRGLLINIGSISPVTATQFSVNNIIENKVLNNKKNMNETSKKLIAASVAGTISAFLYNPVDLIVIQQQKKSFTLNNTIIDIKKRYGISKFCRGINPCILRESMYTSGYMVCSPIIGKQFSNLNMLKDSLFFSKISGCFVAGTIASLATHPIDTAKTIIQADIDGKKHNNLYKTVKSVYLDDGIKGLYRGGIARIIRTCGAFFIFNILQEIYSEL